MPHLEQHQGLQNFLESLVRDHSRYEPIVQFLDNILLNSRQLSWLDLEEVGLVVAQTVQSHFCAGLREGMIATLQAEGDRHPQLDVIKAFARDLVIAPHQVTAEKLDLLRAAGLNDQSIEDLIGWVTILQLYSIMDQAMGFGGLPPEVMREIAGGTVQSKGYMPSFQYFVSMAQSQAAATG